MTDVLKPEPKGRGAEKAAAAYRTIGEVSQELGVPQHVLRFWEGKFPQIKPLKRAGGRRYYRPEDVDLLRRIESLLYRQGYTIKGVQKLLGDAARPERAAPAVEAPGPAATLADADRWAEKKPELRALLDELKKLQDLVEKS